MICGTGRVFDNLHTGSRVHIRSRCGCMYKRDLANNTVPVGGESNRSSVLGTLIYEGVNLERGRGLVWTSS